MRADSWLSFHSVVLLFVAFVLVAVVVAARQLPETVPHNRIWEGYSILLVEREVSSEAVTRALKDEGVTGVISHSTVEVRYNDTDRMGSVPLSEMDQRFLDYDPRLDPYMRSLSSYFVTADAEREYAIYYLSDSQKRRLTRMVEDALAGIHAEWRFADRSPLEARFLPVLFGLTAALVLLYLRTPSIVLVLTAALLGIQLTRVGPGVLFAATILYLLWALLLHQLDIYLPHALNHRETVRPIAHWVPRAAFSVPVIATVLLYGYRIDGGPAALLHVAVVLVILAATAAGLVSAATLKHSRHEHRLFVPVTIVPGGPRRIRVLFGARSAALRFNRRDQGAVKAKLARLVRELRLRGSGFGLWVRDAAVDWPVGIARLAGVARLLLPVAIAVLVVVILRTAWLPSGTAVPVPTPIAVTEAETLSYDSLERLEERRPAGGLPDLAVYLTHRAHQDGFMYGREFRFPERDEELTRQRYVRTEDGIGSTTEVAIRFDEEWREAVWSAVPLGSPMQLLLTQDKAVGVVFESSPALYSARSTVLRHGALVLLVFVPFLFSSLFAFQSMPGHAHSAHRTVGQERDQDA